MLPVQQPAILVEVLCIRAFQFFVFHTKPAATNNHRRELSDIAYLSAFSRHSSDIKKLPSVKKTGLKFLIFRLNSSE